MSNLFNINLILLLLIFMLPYIIRFNKVPQPNDGF